jgi:hypothetical protein
MAFCGEAMHMRNMGMSFLLYALYVTASARPENRDELQLELDNTIPVRFIPIFGPNIKNI